MYIYIGPTSADMIDYPGQICSGSRDLFKFWEISDNFLKLLQD